MEYLQTAHKQPNFFIYRTKICLVVCSLNSNKQTRFLLTQSKPPYVVKSDQYRHPQNAVVSATVVSGFIHFCSRCIHYVLNEQMNNGLDTYIREYVNSTIML